MACLRPLLPRDIDGHQGGVCSYVWMSWAVCWHQLAFDECSAPVGIDSLHLLAIALQRIPLKRSIHSIITAATVARDLNAQVRHRTQVVGRRFKEEEEEEEEYKPPNRFVIHLLILL